MLVKEIINGIIEKSGAPRFEKGKTCDILMTGDENARVNKIATTFMATVDVIREAAKQGVDFIITHEPTWFTGADNTEWLEDDPVYLEKKRLIEENNIAIWRFHDHMHAATEDGIYRGVEAELGWARYKITDSVPLTPFGKPFGGCYQIPHITLSALVKDMKHIFEMDTIQIVGNADMSVERVGVLVGGGSLGLGVEYMPMELMRKAKLDLLVCGEILEWTVTAYVRDAAALGFNCGMLVLGHERSEEAGMKYLPEWIKSVTGEIPVVFIDSKEPFSYL